MESRMHQHGSKCFARIPPWPLAGAKGQNSTFSEHGPAAYQINEITNAAT